MALSDHDLSGIEALLGAPDADAQAFAAVRQQYPGLSLTRCDPSDIDLEQPFRQYPRYSLYLVDSADHCWKLTSDPARATGLVVVHHKVPA
jgi:hypothetical protein